MFVCSGCNSEKSNNLIPDNNYSQIFVEKRLSPEKGDVEYKKNENKEKINKIIDLLNSISVEPPGKKQTNKIESKLSEKGTYILSFLTQKDLDNRTIESVFYLALLPDGYIVYANHKDHSEMRIRLVSIKKKPKLVKKIIEMLY